MPRHKQPGAPEPKRRSRKGCWQCKARKVKCGEEHPACKNCLKNGNVCDYSVRLNWEGRRAKRPVADDGGHSSPTSSSKPMQWFHEFPTESDRFQDASVTWNQQIDDSEVPDESKVDQLAPAAVSDNNATTTNATAKKTKSSSRTLVFIDESQHLLSSTKSSEGCIAKRRLANSQGTTSISSTRRSSLLNSPALGGGSHKKTKSFTEVTKLDIGQSQLMSCARSTQGTGSSTSWFTYPSVFDGPLTPAPSSNSDDIMNRPGWAEFPSLGSPDSWVSGNGESENSPTQSGCLWEEPVAHGLQETLSNSDVYPCGDGALYGYDTGAADEDLLKSDDANNVVLLSPAAYNSTHGIVDFGEEAMLRQKVKGISGLNQSYYTNVVPVVIPWALEPLPDILKESNMNLVYFHHFLDHTSQVLVPYHDAGANPLRTHLAVLALKSRPLMSLILAYSACHRSQLLGTDLPQMRMAEWAQSIFPALREPVLDNSSTVSDVTLAMAVILVALEIMSPGAFGHGVSWREHIAHARSLHVKPLDLTSDDVTTDGFGFLQSWLAYMDVMGNLVAGPRVELTCKPQAYFALTEASKCAEDLDEIDCMMGISVKCARLLGQVAELAKQCQGERFRLDGRLLHGWTPNSAIAEQALSLEQQLMESLRQSSRPCAHVCAGNIYMTDLAEMAAMNEAFHWAGLIHLRRRVLGKDRGDPDIQGHVEKILKCLDHIRVGGAAETRCLFPMFTAGCEAPGDRHLARIVGRLVGAERSGLKQIRSARLLLEQVWTTGSSWEELISNEFIA